MFNKKILGLVGLLFIGSQVSASINECTTEQNLLDDPDCVGKGYCLYGGKIFNYGNDCKLGVTNKVLFVDDTGREVDLESVTATTSGQFLNMYYCDSNSCDVTKGYVKNGNNYFLINEEGIAVQSDISATACTGHVGELISVVTKKGGVDVTEVSLCLTQDKSVILDENDGDSYLAFNLDDLALATGGVNTKVVITKKPNVLLVNKLYSTSGEPECYDSTNAKIMPRIDNFCEGANCDKYYKCNNGVCTLQTSSCPRDDDGDNDAANEKGSGTTTPTCDPTKEDNKCEEGYYLYSKGLIVTNGVDGELYHCEEKEVGGGAEKREVIIECTDVKEVSTGYFKNTAYDSKIAAKDVNHNAQYIKCTSTGTGTVTCEAITVDEGSCSVDGLVYLDESSGNINLCLESKGVNSISIQLTGSDPNDKDYFIKVGGTGNIFGSGVNYTLVTVNNGSVFKSSNSDGVLYKYAGNNYEVLERSAGICKYDGRLYEFGLICENEHGYDASTVYYILKDSKVVTNED